MMFVNIAFSIALCFINHPILFLCLQRSSLRRTMRDSRVACQKANEEMKQWEQKRLDAVNRY